MSPTFVAMLAELERAMENAWSQRAEGERGHRLGDEALLRFLRAFVPALPSAQQRQRLTRVLDTYEALATRRPGEDRGAVGTETDYDER